MSRDWKNHRRALVSALAVASLLAGTSAVAQRGQQQQQPAQPTAAQQQAAHQVTNQLVEFAQLFVQMSDQQDTDDTRIGKDDIVITDTACKP